MSARVEQVDDWPLFVAVCDECRWRTPNVYRPRAVREAWRHNHAAHGEPLTHDVTRSEIPGRGGAAREYVAECTCGWFASLHVKDVVDADVQRHLADPS